MPMTLPINSNYHDKDAQTLLEYLPHLQSQLSVGEEEVAFLRRFLRRKEVQATMKSYKSISILSYRKLRPVSMAAVALAANIFCDIRRCNDHSELSEELLEILSKPNVQVHYLFLISIWQLRTSSDICCPLCKSLSSAKLL